MGARRARGDDVGGDPADGRGGRQAGAARRAQQRAGAGAVAAPQGVPPAAAAACGPLPPPLPVRSGDAGHDDRQHRQRGEQRRGRDDHEAEQAPHAPTSPPAIAPGERARVDLPRLHEAIMDHASDVTRNAARAQASSPQPAHKTGGRISRSWRLYRYMSGLFDKTARIAARQHGRITWEQLVAAGVERWRIDKWVADGRLRPVHQASTRSGHEAPSLLGDYMAAVLACGSGAVLSHRAAGARHAPAAGQSAATGGHRADPLRARAAGHRHPPRQGAAPAATSAWLHGIPMTTVPRTLLDLAPALDLAELTRACHEAWIHHRTTPRFVEDCIARNPGKKGAAKLRAALGADVTLSKLEDGFLALLREHGLPARARTSTPRRQGRLPLAAARPHGRAAELPLPRIAPRVRGRRRAPPALEPPRVHLGRRLRARRADGRRARPALSSSRS